VVIIIEPALRETSRALHHLRDALIADRAATVLAPCTRRGAPCPALADERDWCHDHRPLSLPPRANQLAQVTGLRDGDLKLAYLALAPALDVPLSPALRVVSDPRGEKGKHTLTACGPAGWTPLRLLRRHRSEGTRGFERARRGDLLHITPDPAPRPITLSADPTAADEPVATAVVDLTADDQVDLLALDRAN
jgi:ribosomal protein RSM22 (predicted rRNA methylase)